MGACAKIGEAVGSKLRAKASISARTYGACRTSSPHVVQKHSETTICGLAPTSAVSTLSKTAVNSAAAKGRGSASQRAEMPHGKGAYEVGWNCMDFNKNRSIDVYVADHCSDLAWRHEFVHFYPPAVEGRGDAGRRLPATPWAYHTPTRKQSYSARVSHLKHSLGISGCAPLGSTVSWKSDATPCARGTRCTASLVGSWRVSLPLPPHVASGLHLLLLPFTCNPAALSLAPCIIVNMGAKPLQQVLHRLNTGAPIHPDPGVQKTCCRRGTVKVSPSNLLAQRLDSFQH